MNTVEAGEGDPLAPYDFDLPEEAIALRPARPRDVARLLVAHPDGTLADRLVRDLPDELRAGDLLVVNDSRVIPARLTGVRHRGAAISAVELTLLVEEAPRTWQAFARPAKRLAPGDVLAFAGAGGSVEGAVLSREGPTVRVAFAGDPLVAGSMPLPPYIAAHREPDATDGTDYQTMFARPPGSVAAPTAGLHFTPALLERLEARGIGISRVTLHVGAGTFLPVKVARLEEHRMHAEFGTVGAETVVAVEAAKAAGGRVVAVGTTALRLLETAAQGGRLMPYRGDTRLFIRPGHTFQAVDALMTNFHLPRSTLIVLVAALVGIPRMQAIYAHAVREKYRFYSYGDASLLFPGAA